MANAAPASTKVANAIYDVAIVGTGPAGGMAAVTLAAHGVKTLIIEREFLPRPKACGGALSKTAISGMLDWDISDVTAANVYRIENSFNHSRPVSQTRERPLTFVNRLAFDHAFIERA